MSPLSLRASQHREPIEHWEWVAVVAATVIGAVLRFWALGTIPPGLWYDEAINGLDALSIVRGDGFQLFFMTGGHPREPLYMYFELLGLLVGGSRAESLRAVSALLGAATIPAVWWMARELGGKRLALWTLIFFTPMRWHVHFSRLAFRTILTPLFCALIAATFVRTLREPKRRDALLCGALCGLSLYSYLSMRLFLVAVVLAAAAFFIGSRSAASPPADHEASEDDAPPQFQREPAHRTAAIVGVIAFMVTFLPLGVNYVLNPEHFSGRQDQVSLLDEGGEGFGRILLQTRDVALMGIARGDHVPKHNLPGPPSFLQTYILSPPSGSESAARWEDARRLGTAPDPHGTGIPVFSLLVGLIFYWGLFLLLRDGSRLRWEAIFLLLWFALGSLASILSFGAPNMLRLLLLTPAVAYTLARGADDVLDRLVASRWPQASSVWLIVVSLWFVRTETRTYFTEWPEHPAVWFDFNSNFHELAAGLREQEETAPAILVPQFIHEAPTFRFEADSLSERLFPDTPEGWTAAVQASAGETLWVVVPNPPFPGLRAPAAWESMQRRNVRGFELPGGQVWATLEEANR